MIRFLFVIGMVLLIGLVVMGCLELFSLHDRVEELEGEIEKLKEKK